MTRSRGFNSRHPLQNWESPEPIDPGLSRYLITHALSGNVEVSMT